MFGWMKRSDPQPDLKDALDDLSGRIKALEGQWGAMRLDWSVVTHHVDQQVNKVHRELGHVTKRKADLLKLEPGDDAEPQQHKSRFRGGRSR